MVNGAKRPGEVKEDPINFAPLIKGAWQFID